MSLSTTDARSLSADNSSKFHPIADLWPPMSDAELNKLAENIKFNGIHTPIWRHRDGRIIDGRNRLLACQKAGIECPSRTYKGGDGAELATFAFSLNEHRRHLSADQRSAIAAELSNWTLGRNQHASKEGSSIEPPSPVVSVAEAAAVYGVPVASVKRAKAVQRADPALHNEVKAGNLKSSAARAKVAARKPKAAPSLPASRNDAFARQRQTDRNTLVNALAGCRKRQTIDHLVAIIRKHVPEVLLCDCNKPPVGTEPPEVLPPT